MIRVDYRETQNTDEGLALDDIETDERGGINPNVDATLTPTTGINRPGNGARGINKVARADFRWSLFRTDLRVTGFWRNREEIQPVTIPGLSPTTTDESIGAEFNMNWQLGSVTNTILSGGWTRRNFDTDQDDTSNDSDNYNVDVRLEYMLGLFTDLYVFAGYQTQTSTILEYEELHVGAGFRRFFLRRQR